jgi:FtsP/CotA-like multicopper oxidase with cupredoxin domain
MRGGFRLRALTAIAVAIAAGAAIVMALATADARAQSASQSDRSAPKVFELTIVNGRVPATGNTIRVKKGDDVELRWSSDRPMSLHLHGYDIERRVAPQSPVTMTFKARLTGRFPVSEHGHGGRHERALLYLEVHP